MSTVKYEEVLKAVSDYSLSITSFSSISGYRKEILWRPYDGEYEVQIDHHEKSQIFTDLLSAVEYYNKY